MNEENEPTTISAAEDKRTKHMNHQIPLNKSRYFIAIIISIIFITIASIGLSSPRTYSTFGLSERSIVVYGGTILVIFIFLLIFIIYKMGKHKFGLIINNDGIQDNLAGVNYGLIKWEDIEGFGFKTHVMNKFIVVFLKDEDELYIKVKGFKKTNLKFNKDTFGSPLVIGTTMLKIKYADLELLIKKVAKEKGLEVF